MSGSITMERVHIAFFGLRNVGKSSLVNKIINQNLSIVSDVLGTTTDPVRKSMELLPLGPVMIIDTPGIDDEGELGRLRVKKALQVLDSADIAVLVTEASRKLKRDEEAIIKEFKIRNIPYIIALNKSDLNLDRKEDRNEILVSAKDGKNIEELKERLARLIPDRSNNHLVIDLIERDDVVVLVMPIDKSAPKKRLILPQQEVLRELLENGNTIISCTHSSLKDSLKHLLKPPALVITDSQVFKEVFDLLDTSIRLTSFSILFARYKGELGILLSGTKKLDELEDNSRILISEGCTHHRQCEDIGTVKIPRLIRNYTNRELEFEFTSGGEFPEDLSKYDLIVHCGGCMLNERTMKSRIERAKEFKVPIVNYGMTLAKLSGILDRSMEIF